MEVPRTALDRLDGLVAAESLRANAAPSEARRALRRVVGSGDDTLIDAVIERTAGNLGLVPRTPAFLNSGAVPLNLSMGVKAGRLALVFDRLVLHVKAHWTDKWEREFVLRLPDAQVRWWKAGRPGHSRGFTLTSGRERYRVSLLPPSGTNLSEASGSIEEPSATDTAAAVIELLGKSSEVLSMLGGVGETFSYRKTSKIATLHTELWKNIIARLMRGELPPFGFDSTVEVRAKPTPVRMRPAEPDAWRAADGTFSLLAARARAAFAQGLQDPAATSLQTTKPHSNVENRKPRGVASEPTASPDLLRALHVLAVTNPPDDPRTLRRLQIAQALAVRVDAQSPGVPGHPLQSFTVMELRGLARSLGIHNASRQRKAALIDMVAILGMSPAGQSRVCHFVLDETRLADLHLFAGALGISAFRRLSRPELVKAILGTRFERRPASSSRLDA